MESRIQAINNFYEIDGNYEKMLKQRAKINWIKEGDDNTRFFHNCIKGRQNKNKISGIVINGTWTENPKMVKDEAVNYFKILFKEPEPSRPSFISPLFKKNSELDKRLIEEQFSEEEVKSAIWNCGIDKSPGPDGFSFGFFKSQWNTIKEDIMRFVRDFHLKGKFEKGCNSSFVVLIPKISSPTAFKDYRPISLISSLYKIISKILAERLKGVLSDIIGESQSAYIAKRQILDGVLVTNELMDMLKRKKKKAFIFKADFEKAFDSVNWNFLDSIMEQMNFGLWWRNWINQCLSTARISILVNGSPTDEFNMERGIRQGDPLSPFLFLLVAEALNVLMMTASGKNLFKGIETDDVSPNITHLQFADDTIFFGNWDKDNLINLRRFMHIFAKISGLRINLSKSKLLGINIQQSELVIGASTLGCSLGVFPCKYLGLPIGQNMNRISAWQPVIDRIKMKLAGWKARFLSFGGRLTMIKAVLGSLPLYFFSLFRAPDAVIHMLERLRANFFWGGGTGERKTNWISWQTILKDKRNGGLGFTSLKTQNEALLGKWWWKFKLGEHSLWRRAVGDIYGREGGFEGDGLIKDKGKTWGSIIKNCFKIEMRGVNLLGSIRWVLGNGMTTNFWGILGRALLL